MASGIESLSSLSNPDFTCSSDDSKFEVGLDLIFAVGEETRLSTRVVRFLIRVEDRGVDAARVGALSGCSLLNFVILFGRGSKSSLFRFVVLEICKIS